MQNQSEDTGASERAPLAGDFVEGIGPVSEFFGLAPGKTKRMAKAGELPGVFMAGSRVCGVKSEMRAGILARARGEAA